MKSAGVGRRPKLPKPKHYLDIRVKRIHLRKLPSRALPLGDFYSVGSQPGGGWARFIPPGESLEVQLRIPERGKPYEAMREWFFMREAGKKRRPECFDLNQTSRLWNKSGHPDLTKEACGWFHYGGTRFVNWGPDIQRALEVWEASGFRGPRPYDLLAYLEPDQHLPILPWHPKPDVPAENRLLYVAVDLARPLEDQFTTLQRLCQEIRDYSLLVAGQASTRPGRHEIRRDILVFTLHYSAGLTVAQIAKEIFPHESEGAASRKVKDIIRRMRGAIDEYLLRQQRNTPSQTK